jgi:hypothetical protein
MADRQFQIELAARNSQLAFAANPAEVISWDNGAWRGQRVLAPIMVDALVVPTSGAAASTWAAVAVDPLNAQAPRPAPFDTVTGRAPGVHLHWSLPDGLTRGTAPRAADDTALAAGVNAAVEQSEVRSNQRTTYRPIPDRWLVARIVAGQTPTSPKRVSAWVIESALDPVRRRVTPLNDWREDRSDAAAPAFTAVGPGDPTFAVYYDNTQNVLGFHDGLQDVAVGPLSYSVSGWYSEVDRDPLHAPATEAAWYAELGALGWSIPDASKERLDQAARDAANKRDQLGLSDAVTETRPAYRLASKTVKGALKAARDTNGTQDVAVRLGAGAAKFAKAYAGSKVKSRSLYLAARQRYFEQHWPRQTICHGSVFDVAWNGRGGSFDLSTAGVPVAGSVSVALGNSGAQAIAALVAARDNAPGLERTLAAFHHGSLSDLSLQSGIARLESTLHAEDFTSSPGGFVVSEIEQGDMFPPASGSENSVRPSAARGTTDDARTTEILISKTFYGAGLALADLVQKVQRGADSAGAAARAEAPGGAPAGSPRRTETVRRAMPRWYEPRDPVVLISEAHRSYKHGEDGVLDANGALTCRISGDTVSTIGIFAWADREGIALRSAGVVDVRGSDLTTADFKSGQIPIECGALLYESLLFDPTVVDVAKGVVVTKARTHVQPAEAGAAAVSVARARESYAVEQTMMYAPFLNPSIDMQALAAVSNVNGMVPSKIALQLWQRPWTPLEASWEVQWFPSPNGEKDWELAETDFRLKTDVDAGVGSPALRITGRTLLTPAIARTMQKRLEKFLQDEQSGAQDDATPRQEADLAAIAKEFAKLDVLATSFGGLHLSIMARKPKPGFGSTPDPDAWLPVDDATMLWLVRAGHLRLTRLRIIDTFGQFHDVAAARLAAPTLAEDMRSRAGGAFMQVPPRATESARLMFRMLSAADNTREATRDHTPVCGWVVPDHLDEALELMDSTGTSLGQLQSSDDGRTLEWQGVPGQQDPLGAPPKIAQPQVASFVNGLLQWGLRDPVLAAGDDPPSEHALAALLRMIDATLWTNDPVGRAGNEHLSVIIGHPLALVRAELRLEVERGDDARTLYTDARAEFERTPFPVRLGELLALDDGLMGYFINDDYSRFYPVHESLAPNARPSGPNQGFLGSAAVTPDMTAVPVEHPYIDRTPLVHIRPGQRIVLTLLVDPRGAVHVTSGIVPRKKIELMREHIAPALDAMALTFRVGPVLVDPDTIRMPLPAEIKGGWSWVRKVNVTTWQEDAAVNATQDALLPDAPALLNEGWLKISGALKTVT